MENIQIINSSLLIVAGFALHKLLFVIFASLSFSKALVATLELKLCGCCLSPFFSPFSLSSLLIKQNLLFAWLFCCLLLKSLIILWFVCTFYIFYLLYPWLGYYFFRCCVKSELINDFKCCIMRSLYRFR